MIKNDYDTTNNARRARLCRRDATVMVDGAPTGPKTILRYFPERFRHHHADRIRHVRRPNTNKRTLAIRWRFGLTVCVSMCSHVFVCVYMCVSVRACFYGATNGRPCAGMEETRARRIDHSVRDVISLRGRMAPWEIKRFVGRQHCLPPYLYGRFIYGLPRLRHTDLIIQQSDWRYITDYIKQILPR